MAIWSTAARRRKDPGREEKIINEFKEATQRMQEECKESMQRMQEEFDKQSTDMKSIADQLELIIVGLKQLDRQQFTQGTFEPGDQREAPSAHTAPEEAQKQNSEGHRPTTNMPAMVATTTLTLGLIVRSRRFPDPKYLQSTQQGGGLTLRCFAFTAKRPTARAPTTSPATTTDMAMLIRAEPKNSNGVVSDFISKTATEFTTAPANQQDSTAVKFCAGPTFLQKFSRSVFDKANQALFTYDPTGPTTDNFNTARTLGATLRAEHYAAFRRPPPTYDKIFRSITMTTRTKTLGATLRKEHYEKFRRPPPTRDKHYVLTVPKFPKYDSQELSG